ncbi:MULTISPECIES: hypothetical protein [Acidobacteriaceae]|uniref:hypothetical protein n=1 Tax=Acidobacteriaceae TaxID=204434 RepID=UPI0015766410|nr:MULTISPECIES: hypothetical protein [Acidobacteriaceae]MDW5266669.1 hypothetical protein [Edaphobacter sp.]
MPSQEIFLKLESDGKHIEVVKTYDSAFAKEAFAEMNDDAKAFLGKSLIEDGVLEASELPFSDDDLWQGVEEGAREDWNSFSYFVVREEGSERRDLFVSSNWPVAERFAKLGNSALLEV